MKLKKLVLAGLASVAVLTVASCGPTEVVDDEKPNVSTNGTKTYRIANTVSPSNWNEMSAHDANDDLIKGYIGSSFFTFDYKFDADGNIVDGDFDVKYEAATKLEDVTKTYATNDNYLIPDDAKTGYAYKITLREDLKWDDGTPIKADDFVYSMKEQLNPDFLHYRANSYYKGSTVIHNAENYVKQGQDTTASPQTAVNNEGLTLEGFLENYGDKKSYVNWAYSFGKVYENGAWRDATAADNKVVDSKLTVRELYDLWHTVSDFTPEQADEFFLGEASIDYKFPEMTFDKVGLFKGATDYELVIVLDAQLELLDANGNLTFKAAYNMNSLPLAKKETSSFIRCST